MNKELFRSNYKKQHGSTKNATKAWNKRLEAQGRAKRKAERLKQQKAFEDSLLHEDPRENI